MTTTDTDDELEAAVICAYLWAKPPARRHAEHTITPHHFHHGRNRTIWEHATRINNNGGTLSVVALIDALEQAGQLDAAGGPIRIGDIQALPHVGATQLPDLTERLNTRARRRHAITAARDLDAQLHTPTNDLDAVIHRGVAEILHAGRRTTTPTLDHDTIAAELDELWAHGPDRGWDSGWKPLDRLYRPTTGQLTVITGIPNAGKTTWLNAYLTRLTHRHQHRYLLFSPEQSTTAKHARNLATVHAGANLSPELRGQAARWVLDRFRWIDHTETTSVDDLLTAARYIHDTHPYNGLVIDPWNWLEATRPNWMTETEFVGHALNQIVRAAQDLNIHVWVVAHPRKVEQATDGVYKVARPYDIAGSANWFNKPWFVLSLWRDHLADGTSVDRDPNVVQVHVQKVRDDDQGQIGLAELRMQPESRRYAPLSTFGGPL